MTQAPHTSRAADSPQSKLALLRTALAKSVTNGHAPADQSVVALDPIAVSDELFRRAPEDFLTRSSVELLSHITSECTQFLSSFHSSGSPSLLQLVQPPDNDERSPRAIFYSAIVDRPFVVDTITEWLRTQGLRAEVLLHPIVELPNGKRVSLVYGEIEGFSDERSLKQTSSELELHLIDLIQVTDDFPAMLFRVETTARMVEAGEGLLQFSEGERKEVSDFLRWLADGGFVFLGCREWTVNVAKTTNSSLEVSSEGDLGLFRSTDKRFETQLQDITRDAQYLVENSLLHFISATLMKSPIHRAERMDVVVVRSLSTDGTKERIQCFLGLLTSMALSQEASSVPLIRRKLRKIIELEGVAANSHDYKQMVSIIDSAPKSKLFRFSLETLRADVKYIMGLQGRTESRLRFHLDPSKRLFTIMIMMPKERYSDAIRERIQTHLENRLEVEAGSSEHRISYSDDQYLRINFFIPNPRQTEVNIDVAELEQQISALTLAWDDHLRAHLLKRSGRKLGIRLFDRYRKAFPEDYRAGVTPESACFDIERLEAISHDNPLEIALRAVPGQRDFYDLRIYKRQGGLSLSRIVPILENVGFDIDNEYTTHLGPENAPTAAIYELRVQPRQSEQIDLNRAAVKLLPALKLVFRGRADNDKFNMLLIEPGLDWREISFLRAMGRYLWQTKGAPSVFSVSLALYSNPRAAQILAEAFAIKFNPNRAVDSATRESEFIAIKEEFIRALKNVRELVHDRILRALMNVIDSTVRTNFYHLGEELNIGIKVRSRQILQMPSPRPLFEIYVSSVEFEAVHLRGDKVARGGIRWSTRHEDYRTEVLGLMKTQMVKNAIIVPAGAKGGFIIKPMMPEPSAETVRTCYRKFVRTLLQLTDNIRDGKVVHPPEVIVYDDDDPYLVVAADKGTATFSDLANEVSVKEFDFWLGDAFASGGSQGYDHKKLGITARGAWEAVKRHFQEMDVDVFKQEFTATGIGDMAGDVFGNGLIYTDKIRLIAAFNHKHIFLDPTPDAAKSMQERKRLFELLGSQWSDYNTALISAGGGVFVRTEKEIALSPEARVALGTDAELVSGEDLVRIILKAPVDLIWNGGIGTYVKASWEDNNNVGDRTNDDVRIDANELRAKVVGEGGNLGFTQGARIEFARIGGRVNTDAVDNSGGVDLSDHEVNIKILLSEPVRSGELTEPDRNTLLRSLAQDMVEAVTRDNNRQSLALSLELHRSRQNLAPYRDLIPYLESAVNLDRKGECLPNEEALDQCARLKTGLTRPELAVLSAYTKMSLFRIIMNSTLPEESFVQSFLTRYFPKTVVERYPTYVANHPLRAEIIATQIANAVVDRMGIVFAHQMMVETNSTILDVLSAYLIAESMLDTRLIFRELSVLDRAGSTHLHLPAILGVTKSIEGIVHWLLETRRAHPETKTQLWESYVEQYQKPLATLIEATSQILPPFERNRFEEAAHRFVTSGFPEKIARTISSVSYAPAYLDIAQIAQDESADLLAIAQLHTSLSAELQVHQLLDHVLRVEPADHWEDTALRSAASSIRGSVNLITRSLLHETGSSSLEALHDYLQARREQLGRFRKSLAEFQGRAISLPALFVLTSQLRGLSGGRAVR